MRYVQSLIVSGAMSLSKRPISVMRLSQKAYHFFNTSWYRPLFALNHSRWLLLSKSRRKSSISFMMCDFSFIPFCHISFPRPLVILLAFASWRLGKRDAHYGRARQGTGDALVESVHVLWKKSLADQSESMNLLRFVGHDFGLAERQGRLVLQGETAVLRANRWRTTGYG